MHVLNIHRGLIVTGLVSLLIAGCEPRNGPSSGSPARSTDGEGMATPAGAPALAVRSDLIPVGEKAPDFEAIDHRGEPVHLRALLDQGPVVLVFYPKDDTPVCTKQLCAFRDDWTKFEERKVAVLGVNPGDRDSHAAFAAKHHFPFPVVVDRDSRIAAGYGCEGTPVIKRTVYVIGRDGKVLLAERGVVPHDRIFAALDRG